MGRELDEERKRTIEIAESFSSELPELSKALKELISKKPGIRMNIERDGSVELEFSGDPLYEQNYLINFKCKEKRCRVSGIIKPPGDEQLLREFRGELRKYGCKTTYTQICEDEYCLTNIAIKCFMDTDKFIDFINKILKR
jgi:hypothetical protein